MTYSSLKENQTDLQRKNFLYQKYLSTLKQFEETHCSVVDHGFLKTASDPENIKKIKDPLLFAYIVWRQISMRESRSQFIHKFFLNEDGSIYHASYFDQLLSGIAPSTKVNFFSDTKISPS